MTILSDINDINIYSLTWFQLAIISIILLIDIESQMESEASKTLEMVELGNLDFDFPIEQGILLLGQTKAGKTTTAHHLVRQLLDDIKNESGNNNV